MSPTFDRKLFQQIFSDAHVVDVDFSNWDESVSLCVVADHVKVPTESRLPLFLIEFLRISKFHVNFNHLEVEVERPEEHFQWNIDEFRIQIDKCRISVSLFGGKTWPKLDITCEGIEIRPIANSLLDELFPGWNKPFSGMARPGIEALARVRRIP